ncbi:MAG: YabP/YqfC family sporulation protein [Christensenellaceae bacterium]|jgi:sporulation protein YqfC|nr:YabP/YqfC family sporulation protein [Christensenellaceae bacterium]
MKLYNKAVSRTTLSPDAFVGGFKISLYDGTSALIEGRLLVYGFTKNQITMRVGNTIIIVDGQNLRIEFIGAFELYIKGEINGIEKKKKLKD